MKQSPSMDEWIREAKCEPDAPRIGMYLFHNGVVREDARKAVRDGEESRPVKGMLFSYNEELVAEAVDRTLKMPGIYYVRTWLNEGELSVGDDIMYVLIGGDIRPHVVDALNKLVGDIKDNCVTETELLSIINWSYN